MVFLQASFLSVFPYPKNICKIFPLQVLTNQNSYDIILIVQKFSTAASVPY